MESHSAAPEQTDGFKDPPFQDPTSLANWARALLCVSVVAEVVGIAHHARAYRSFAETGEVTASPELWATRILLWAAALTTAVLVSKWIYRANCNARALGASEMAFTPGGAVGWYFVPIANLWKPYQAMREIWQASMSPSGWRRQQVSVLVPCWWLLGILGSSTAGVVTWAAQRGVDAIDARTAEHLGEAVAQGVLIPASLLLLVMISRIHDMQMAHYRRQLAAGKTPSRAGAGRRLTGALSGGANQTQSPRRNSTAVP